MVSRVGDNDVPFGRVSDALGAFEFTFLHSLTSILEQETSMDVKNLRGKYTDDFLLTIFSGNDYS